MAQPEGKVSASIATSRTPRMPIGQLPPSMSPVVYIVHDEVARQKLLRHQPSSATASAVATEGRPKAGSSTPALPIASVMGNGNGSSSANRSSCTPNLAVLATPSSSVSTAAAAAAASAVANNATVLLGVASTLSAPVVTGTALATARSASTPPVTPLPSAAGSSPAGSGSSGGAASAGGGGSCSGAGRYQCVHCGRSCAKPSVLEKHLRAHTGERPYPCQPCGFSFKTKSNLYKHRKSRSHLQRVGAALPDAASTPTGATSVAVSRSLRHRTAPVATEDDGSGECGGAAVDELSSAGGIDDDVDECYVDYFDDVDDVDAAGNGSGDGGGGGGGEDESLSNSSTLSCSTVSCGSVHLVPDDKEGRDCGGVPAVGEEEPPAKRLALSASGSATGTTASAAVVAAARCRDQALDVRNVQTASSAGCDVPRDLSASSPVFDATNSGRSVMQATDLSGGVHSSSRTPSVVVAVEPLRIRVAAATVVPAVGSRTSSFAQPLEDDIDADAALTRSADSPASVPPLSSSPLPVVQLRQQQLLPTRSGESRVAVTADKVALRERIQHLIDTNSLIMSTPLAEVQRFKRVSRLPSLNGLPIDEPSIAVVGLASTSAGSAAVPQQQQQQQLVDSGHSPLAVGTPSAKATSPFIILPVASGVNDLTGVRLISDVTTAATAPAVRHMSPKPSAIVHQLSSPAHPESRAGAVDASHGCVAVAVADNALSEQSELALSDGGRTASAAAPASVEQQQQQQQKTCTVGGVLCAESGGQSCSGSVTRPAAVLQCSQAPAGQPAPALAARARDGRCTSESRGEQLPVPTGTSAGSSSRLAAVPVLPAAMASAKPLVAAHQLLTSAVKLEPGTLVQVVLPPPASQSSSVPSSAAAVPSPTAQLASQLVLCKADAGRQAGGLSQVQATSAAAVLSSVQLQRLQHVGAIHIEVSTKEAPSGSKPPEPGDRGMKRALSDAGSPRPKLVHTFHQVEGAKIAGLVPRPSVRRQLSEARDCSSTSGGSSSNHGDGDTGRLMGQSSSVLPPVVLHDEHAAVRPLEESGARQSTLAVSTVLRHSAATQASDTGVAAAMVVAASGGRLPAGASGVPAVIVGTVPASSASPLISSSQAVAVGKSDRSTVYGSSPILLFAPGASSAGQLVQQNQELPCSSTDTAVSLSVPGLTRAALDSTTTKCAAGQAAIASGSYREVPTPIVGVSSICSSSSACDSGGLPTTTAAGGSSTSSSVPGSATWKEQLRGRILQRRSMSTEHGGGGGSLPSPAINGVSTAVDFSSSQPQPLLSSVTSSSLVSSAEMEPKTPAGKSGNSVATGLTREAADIAVTSSVSTSGAGLAAASDCATILELATRRPSDRMWQPSPFFATERTSLPAENRPLSIPATSLVFVAAAPQGSSGVVTAAANPATFAGRFVRIGVLPPASASATTAPSPVWPFAPVDTSRPCSMPLVAVAPHCVWPAAAPLKGLASGQPVRLELPSAAISSAGLLPSIFFASPVSGVAGAPRSNSAATAVLLLSEKAAHSVVASSYRDGTVFESGRTAACCEPSAIVGPATWLSSAAFRQDLMKAGGGHFSTVADPGIPVPPLDASPPDAAPCGRSTSLTVHIKSTTIDGSCTVASAPVPDDGRRLPLQSSVASFWNGSAACAPNAEVRDASCGAEAEASAGTKRRAPLSANDKGQLGVAMTVCKAADIEEPSQKRSKPDSAVQPSEAEESVEMAASTVLRAEPRLDCAAVVQPPPAAAQGKLTSPAPHMLSVASTSLSSFFKLAVPCTSSMFLSTLARPDQRTVYRVMLQPVVTRSLPTGRSDPVGIKSSSFSGDSSSQACAVVASTAASGSYKLDAKLSAVPAIGSDGSAKLMDDRVATAAAVALEVTQPAPTTSTKWCLHRPQPSTTPLPGASAQPCSACVREYATAAAASAAAAARSAASEAPTSAVPLHCTQIPSVQCLSPVQAAGQLRPEIVYASSRGDVRSIITHSSYWSYQSKLRLVGDSALSPTGANRPKLSVSEAVSTAVRCSELGKLDHDTERLSHAVQLPGQRELHLLHHQGEQLPTASKAVKGLVRSLSTPETGDDGEKRVKIFVGGFKSEEEYTYIRGRGRGKYVCERCGIRCKKPSMLKKHIRTHTDLRPYSCKHCDFSFKTKGNLTKHMRSKAHHKRCLELGIVPVPTNVDDSQIDAVALAQQQEISRESRIKGEDDFDDDLQIVMEGDYDDDDDDEDTDEDDEDDDEDTEDDADQPEARISAEFGRPAVSRDMGARLLGAVGRMAKDPSAGVDRTRDADVLPSSGQREPRAQSIGHLRRANSLPLSARASKTSKSKTGIAIDESADIIPQQYLKDASHVAVKHEHGAVDSGRSVGLHGRSSTGSAVRGQAAAAATAARESIDNEVARSLLDLSKMPVPCRTAAQQQKQLQPPQSSARQLSTLAATSDPSPAATDGKTTASKDGGSQRGTRGGRGGDNRFETFVGVALTMNKQNTPETTSNTSSKPDAAAVLIQHRILQSAQTSVMPQRPGGGPLATAVESGASLASARLPVAGTSSAAAAAAASPASEWCQVCEVHLQPHSDPNEHRRSRLHMDKLEERGHLLAPSVCQPLPAAAVLASTAASAAKPVALQSSDSVSIQCSSTENATDVPVAPVTERDSELRHWHRQRATAGGSGVASAAVPVDPAEAGPSSAAAVADGTASRSRRFRHPHSNQHQTVAPATKLLTSDFACSHAGCGKQCSNKDSLKNHTETHIDSTGFTAHDRPGTKCDVCEKKFKSISGLKQHLVTHAQLRPYVCEYCDAGFTAAQSLKFHLRTHTQERPYICTHCGDTFARSDHLKQHTKRHMKSQEPPDTADVAPAITSTHKPSLTRDATISSFVPPLNLKANLPEISAETTIHSMPNSSVTYITPVADASARHASSTRKKDSSDSCVADQSSLPTVKPTHLRTHTGAHTLGSHSNAFAGKEG